jgi:phosphoesterase RecJ-like protein
MNKTEKLLKKQIKKAKNILLLTHKGPDIDAFSSMLLMYKAIREIYPEKQITMKARQYPSSKLPLMKELTVLQKEDSIKPEGEDLIIITDSSLWKLCQEEGDTIRESNAPVFFIDHHRTDIDEDERKDQFFINESRSSATEQVYVTLKKIFGDKFKVDEDAASLVQYGIISDTGRFLFDLTTPETFRVFAEVMEIYRVDVEDFEYRSAKFPREATDVVIEYLKTLTIEGDMAYMYISQDIIDQRGFEKQAVNEAFVFLKDKYLRFIQGVHWGFIVKPMFNDENEWSISFRSTKGYQDVEVIAKELNGGGHEYASAVKIKANTVDEILDAVLNAVKKVTS